MAGRREHSKRSRKLPDRIFTHRGNREKGKEGEATKTSSKIPHPKVSMTPHPETAPPTGKWVFKYTTRLCGTVLIQTAHWVSCKHENSSINKIKAEV